MTIDLRAQHGHDGAYCCADHRARDADMRGERDRGRSCCGAGDNLRNGKSLEQLLFRRNRLGLSDKLFLFALVDTGATAVGSCALLRAMAEFSSRGIGGSFRAAFRGMRVARTRLLYPGPRL